LNKLVDALGQLVERTTPYTPEQDGKSERSIYIILDRARCIRIDQDIPEFLWDEITGGDDDGFRGSQHEGIVASEY
jgi:hypothetical protein